MKKFILISSMFMFLELKPYTVSVLVPRDAVSNGTLFVYMHDKQGKELVGKYILDTHTGRIAQNQLEITNNAMAHENELVLEILASENQAETASSYVVVSLELDETMHVIKVLVVKDYFFDTDIFDVLSISADEMKTFCDEMMIDDFSNLSNDVADLDLGTQTSQIQNLTSYQKIMVMMKFYALMYYGKAQRMLNNLYDWRS